MSSGRARRGRQTESANERADAGGVVLSRGSSLRSAAREQSAPSFNAPMSLVSLRDAHVAFGERPLLDGAQLTVMAGERLGLIGRNGTGKSTLLAILAGHTPLDEGELQRRDGLRLALVEQEPELPTADSLHESLQLRARLPVAVGAAPAAVAT